MISWHITLHGGSMTRESEIAYEERDFGNGIWGCVYEALRSEWPPDGYALSIFRGKHPELRIISVSPRKYTSETDRVYRAWFIVTEPSPTT